MNKKICVVTGATSGIGKEIAKDLAQENCHVILIARNPEKAQKILMEIQTAHPAASVESFIADLSSQQSIYHLAKQIHEKFSHIDVLINNAGCVSLTKTFSKDHIELTLATNHLGPFLLTNLLIDLLKKSQEGRVINVSSNIHKWAALDIDDLQYEQRKYQILKAYAQSKLLMNLAALALAHQLANTSVTVNCIHPGAVKTNLGSDNATSPFLKILDKLIKIFFISPAKAAKPVVRLALSDDYRGVTGKYFEKNKMVRASRKSRDENLANLVWKVSEALVKPDINQ